MRKIHHRESNGLVLCPIFISSPVSPLRERRGGVVCGVSWLLHNFAFDAFILYSSSLLLDVDERVRYARTWLSSPFAGPPLYFSVSPVLPHSIFVRPSPVQVLWEDDFMAVIVKPQGVAVRPSNRDRLNSKVEWRAVFLSPKCSSSRHFLTACVRKDPLLVRCVFCLRCYWPVQYWTPYNS